MVNELSQEEMLRLIYQRNVYAIRSNIPFKIRIVRTLTVVHNPFSVIYLDIYPIITVHTSSQNLNSR